METMRLDWKVFQKFEVAPEYIGFAVFNIIFIITIGPAGYFMPDFFLTWDEVVLLGCLFVVLIASFIGLKSLNKSIKYFIYLCFLFAALLIVVGGMHLGALVSINPFTVINSGGEIVKNTLGKVPLFLCLYIFFPVLFVVQIYLYQKLQFLMAVRIIAGVFFVSLIVLYYQSYFDPQFLNDWQTWTKQVNGLASDPNAFSLSAFLVIVLLVSGACLTEKWSEKFFFISIVGLLTIGLFLAGGRTAVGGTGLFIISWPIVLAIAKKEWSGNKRVFVSILPFLLLLFIVSCMPLFNGELAHLGIAGKRIANTYAKFEQHGIINGIFSSDEARGELFRVGFSLIEKSPLAGWGPWGFYHEYPNEIYLASREIKPAFDMVLNHYLVVAVDFGIPLLVLNLILLFIPLVGAFFFLKNEENYNERLSVATLVVGNVLFLLMISLMPPSYFPDVLWIWTGQLAYLAVIAEKKGFLQNFNKSRTLNVILATLIVIPTVIGTYQTSFGSKGYLARSHYPWWPTAQLSYDYGCFPADRLGDGSKGRWCGKNSIMQIPITAYAGEHVEININNEYPDLRGNPVVLQYGGKDKWDSEIVLKKKEPTTVKIPLDDDHIYRYTLKNGKEEKYLVISFNPSRTWIPSKHGVGNNSRQLGVLVTIPEL